MSIEDKGIYVIESYEVEHHNKDKELAQSLIGSIIWAIVVAIMGTIINWSFFS